MKHARTVGVFVAGAIVASAVMLAARKLDPEPPITPSPHLPPSTYLPESARGLLHARMARHAVEMKAVGEAAILLDFDTAAASASRIASDANLARPIGADATELNASLPPRFFELQDQLKASATRVAEAARAKNVDQFATAYSELTRGCVSCHGVYLRAQEK